MILSCILTATCAEAAPAASAQYAQVPGGTFETALPPAPGVKSVTVRAFRLDRTPVTNAQFAHFLSQHPQWRRDRIARIFADETYLEHWQSPVDPGTAIRGQPVVHVSWFAAIAYCESRGARLPTWLEWEYAAAASDTRPDARGEDSWRQQLLTGYSRPTPKRLADVGRGAPNFYGVHDLHGLIWEWVQDRGGMLASADSREQDDPDVLRFCGPGALMIEQKDNYAILMRIASLSSMQASYTTATMGFRCAADPEGLKQ